MESNVPDIRPLRISTGNKNWYGKVLFFFLILDIPKFEIYCRKIPPECSIHHELYHQISSYPDCKTRDLLPSLLLRVELLEEMTAEWSDPIDINNQGTQVSDPHVLPKPGEKVPFLRFW